MEYKLARDVRGRSLSSLIVSNITEGKNVTSAIKGALSQKLRARGTAIKEKFDPLNIVRFMTGGSRLATAVAGRLTGRKRSDIEYFAGTRQRKTYTPLSKGAPGELDSSSVGLLSDILSFMKQTYEDDRQRQQTEKAFREEKENEEQRRHDRFLAVLQQYVSVTSGIGPTPKQEPEPQSFISKLLSSIKSAIGGIIDAMKAIISSVFKGIVALLSKLMGGIASLIGTLLTGMGKVIANLIGKLLSGLKWLGSLKKFFKGPFFRFITKGLFRFLLRFGGPLALAYALGSLLFKASKETPDMKYLTPDQALRLLNQGQYGQMRQYGGYDKLVEMAKGKEKAQNILNRLENGEETDELKKEILDMGGLSMVKRIAESDPINISDIPTKESLMSRFREQVESYGIHKRKGEWEQLYGGGYDPATGRRLDLMEFEGPLRHFLPGLESKKTYEKSPTYTGKVMPPPEQTSPVSVTPIPPRQIEQTPLIDYNEGSLMMQMPDTNIVNRSSNPVNLPDKPQPVSASVRNKEQMLRHVVTGRVIVGQ